MAQEDNSGDVNMILDQTTPAEFRQGTLATYSNAVSITGTSSASEAASGQMPEGTAFMKVERQARDVLAQVMSKTLQGLEGYGGAVEAVFVNYTSLHELTAQRAKALLKPSDAPAVVDPHFNPDWVHRQQTAHPEIVQHAQDTIKEKF